MREGYWLDAAAHLNIQPSEFDKLTVGRMRDLEAAINQIRKELQEK